MYTQKRENVADRLFNFRPLFFSAASLALGIVFAYLHIFKDVSAWWSMALLPFAAASFCFCKSLRRLALTAAAVGWLCACFCFGYSAFTNKILDFTDARQYNGQAEVVGEVEEKTLTDYMLTVVLRGVQIDGEGQDGRLIAYLSPAYADKIRLADVVRGEGFVQTDVSFYGEYGFRANDLSENVRFSLTEMQALEVIGRKFAPFAAIRTRMERVVYAGMDETPAAVTMAVLTGDTSGIDYELLENVRRGGIAHIFAVSGLHVGALYAFCLLLIRKTPLKGLPKPVHFILLAFILCFYAGVCGFTASVVRALILCLVTYAAKLLGLKSDGLETLGLAAFLILLVNPIQLFCVGFQLSFAACFGIVFLAKPLGHVCDETYDRLVLSLAGKRRERLLQRRKEREDLPPTVWESVRRALVSLLSVSLAAQIATSPILLQMFGYVSCWSLVLNLLFVPLISAAFSLLLFFVFIACALPVSAANVILYLPSMLWSATLLVFEACDFSSFMIRGFSLPVGGAVCYYLACTFCSDKWNLSAKIRRYCACGLTLGVVVATFLYNLPLIS
ncbi:MAG: ComEC/Rec2 family competence protein [Clostridia bacterium]|nr:ComEC/Rec2 family competence protein [Clostridia bacterium]